MVEIPTKFIFNGKQYCGFLNSVSGTSQVFHMMIDYYYIGQLFYTDRWEFHGNKLDGHSTEELTDLLGNYLTAWYQ